MLEKDIDAEVQCLLVEIEVDNPDYLECLPFGKDDLLHILKYALQRYDSSILRKIFKNIKSEQWNLIKTKSGKDYCEEFKGYKDLSIFEFCRENYSWSSYIVSHDVRIEKTEKLKHFIEIMCQIIRDRVKNLVKEIVSWRKDNPKDDEDLIDFIFVDKYNIKLNFFKKYQGLIERLTPNIWKELSETEKSRFSYILLWNFQEQINSLQDINLKDELEKYFDNCMMKLLKDIESEKQELSLKEGEIKGINGSEFFQHYKNEALNKFVFRKIGYPLFIKDNISDEEFIDYIINVELNINFDSRTPELEKIDTDTDSDFIWKIICTLSRYHFNYNSEKIKNVFSKRDDLVETVENAKIRFSENFKNKHLGIDKKITLLFSINTQKAFYKAFEMLIEISNDIDIFSMLKYLDCDGYEIILTENRKWQINELLKKEILQQEEADKLIAMAESKERNYYAWSDAEIKECLPEADLEKLHVNLEPEFMVRLFEISILSIIKHKPKPNEYHEQFCNYKRPFVMQVFNKSYADRPSIWAKHLIKIAEEWQGSENMLMRICIALGHLREPLGGKVPISLKKIADRQENEDIRRKILTYRNLFNREGFNRGHHKKPFERVGDCKEELIDGIYCRPESV